MERALCRSAPTSVKSLRSFPFAHTPKAHLGLISVYDVSSEWWLLIRAQRFPAQCVEKTPIPPLARLGAFAENQMLHKCGVSILRHGRLSVII